MATKKQLNSEPKDTANDAAQSKQVKQARQAAQAKESKKVAKVPAKATEKTSPKKKTATTTPLRAPRKPLARRSTKTEIAAESSDRTDDTSTTEFAASPGVAVVEAPRVEDTSSNIPWRRIDLHIHTPGSHDYEQPDKTYLDILKQAEKRGLSIIAFTDHNTVNGYRNMMNEIEHLEYLERLGRIHGDELWRLNEYRRLMKKILVLPGFEFTATFGFHILGIFSPDKSLRDIERVLMDLRVPGLVLDKGLTEAGATSDVLAAYEAIDEAGGIAIAAHANSSNGVSMRGMNLGGQTRIAFTQDPHLAAIEFTDLDKGRHSSAYLFTGVKPEYPRRMFAIQGSDAHRLAVARENNKRLGVGERPTEVQLEDVSFDALKALFRSQNFHRVRPVFTVVDVPDDALALARQLGASATASFHPALPKRGDRFEAIVRDIAAMANGEGGSVFIGCDATTTKKILGVSDAADVVAALAAEIEKRVAPHLPAHIGVNDADGAKVVVIRVPAGTDAPYTVDTMAFLVRAGVETRTATRDEIVSIARRGFEKIRAQQGNQAQQTGRNERHERQERQEGRQSHDNRRTQQQHGQQRYQQGGSGQQRSHDQDRRQTQQGRRNQPQQSRSGQQRHSQRGGQPQQQNTQHAATPPIENLPVEIPEMLEQSTMPSSVSDVNDATTNGVNSTSTNGATPAATNGNSNKGNPTTAEPAPTVPGMPRTGVQVTTMETRNGVEYFTVRDLRNNSVIRNVTKKSARDLWHYAVSQHAEHPGGYDPSLIDWAGDTDRAVLSREHRAGKMRSDLALLTEDGHVLVFYGVTDDGVDEEWKSLIADFEAARAVNVADRSNDD
jgi:hypothetical protein